MGLPWGSVRPAVHRSYSASWRYSVFGTGRSAQYRWTLLTRQERKFFIEPRSHSRRPWVLHSVTGWPMRPALVTKVVRSYSVPRSRLKRCREKKRSPVGICARRQLSSRLQHFRSSFSNLLTFSSKAEIFSSMTTFFVPDRRTPRVDLTIRHHSCAHRFKYE